jgi:hypothetical protein
MRLTLRTLLGYLDDLLEPQQAKALGEKVNESGYASKLVTRIKDVTRRRRLTAPEVSGPGSNPDPNIVAEYLDNTLPPERVEDFERLCLQSDVHLAEVAACHQILTLVLGEPVDVSADLRERMYALGHTETTAPDSAENDGRRPAPAKAPVSAVGPVAAAASPAVVPDYLKSGSRWKQFAIPAAVLLLVALWLGLIFSDPAHPWRQGESERVVQAPVAAPIDDEGMPAEQAGQAVPEPVEEAAPEVAAGAAEPISPELMPDQPAATASLPAEPAAAVAIAEPAPTIPAEQTEPATPPDAAAVQTPASAAPAEAQATPAQPPPVVPATPRLVYNSTEGVLLREDEAGDWKVLPRTSLVRPGERLVSPEPFESLLEELETAISVNLVGGTRVTLLPAPADGPLAFNVDSGRLIFRRPAVGGTDDVASFALLIYGSQFTLDLLTRGAEIGLEVRPHMSAGPPDRMQPLSYDGAFFLTHGQARLTSADGAVWQLQEGAGFLEIVDGVAVTTPIPLDVRPEWMTPLTGGALSVARATAHQFESGFSSIGR